LLDRTLPKNGAISGEHVIHAARSALHQLGQLTVTVGEVPAGSREPLRAAFYQLGDHLKSYNIEGACGAELPELLEQQQLVCVAPRQAVGAQHRDVLDDTVEDGVAQVIEARSVVTVVWAPRLLRLDVAAGGGSARCGVVSPVIADGADGFRDVVVGAAHVVADFLRSLGDELLDLLGFRAGDDRQHEADMVVALEHGAPGDRPALDREHEARGPWLGEDGAVVGAHVERAPAAAVNLAIRSKETPSCTIHVIAVYFSTPTPTDPRCAAGSRSWPTQRR